VALSPVNAWYETCDRADTALRYLIEIDDDTTQWQALDGPCDLIDEPVSVQSVASVSVELDPFTREPQSGAVEVVVEDDWLRPILVANRLKHQKCTIKLGGKELAEGSFLSAFAGPIEGIQPEGGRRVTLTVEDVFTVLSKTEIVGYWCDHPLLAIYDILANKVGLPAAFIDANSLDPTNYSDLGHIQVCRGVGMPGFQVSTGVTEPTPAFDIINQLCRLLNGQLLADEAGKLAFHQFDASASSLGDWDDDVILPGSFEQDGDEGRIVNRIVIDFAHGVDGKANASFEANDTDSQSDHAYPGMADRILSEQFETEWTGFHCQLESDIDAADPKTISIIGQLWAFSGTRDAHTGAPANSTIHADRPAYLLIVSPQGEREIVKCTTALTYGNGLYEPMKPDDPTTKVGTFKTQANYINCARAQFNTTAKAFKRRQDPDAAYVYDVTALALLSVELLNRFQDEIHTIKVATGFGQYEKQLGDFITPITSQFLAYGKDGLSVDKFEIVGKRVDKYGRPPHIEWTLAGAGVSVGTHEFDPHGKFGLGVGGTGWLDLDFAITREDLAHTHVSDGLGVEVKAGFIATLGSGSVTSAGGHTKRHRDDYDRTFAASKDTFVIFSAKTGVLEFRVENLGASKPTDLGAGDALIAAVKTDGAGITAITDLRTTTAMNGVRLDQSTVGVHQSLGADVRSAINRNSHYEQYTRG